MKGYEKDSSERSTMRYQLRLDEVCVFLKAVDPQVNSQLQVVFLARENGKKSGGVEWERIETRWIDLKNLRHGLGSKADHAHSAHAVLGLEIRLFPQASIEIFG